VRSTGACARVFGTLFGVAPIGRWYPKHALRLF